MNHDVVVVRPLCESLCLSGSQFQLHWQSAPVGKYAQGKRTNKTEFTVRNVGKRLGKT